MRDPTHIFRKNGTEKTTLARTIFVPGLANGGKAEKQNQPDGEEACKALIPKG
ncbi:MAG: hypothetical protein ACI4PW_09160 [Alphaproteobacteria bacterium]